MPDEPNNVPDPAHAFQGLLAKHNNDATAVAAKLFDENFQLRTKNRELSDKLPKDGSTVLTADEAKAWIAKGALPTDTVRALLVTAGVVEKA